MTLLRRNGALSGIVLVLLLLLSSIAGAVADVPFPQCQSVADVPHLRFIAKDNFPRDLKSSVRRNARYFFGGLQSIGNELEPLMRSWFEGPDSNRLHRDSQRNQAAFA
ncbi:hypothetical protein XI09_16200 [Bradyrhizobium sp. CCBAU 11386]|nr:hypothetical protein [Bradyrhizobium sp. CCBAU 11386]